MLKMRLIRRFVVYRVQLDMPHCDCLSSHALTGIGTVNGAKSALLLSISQREYASEISKALFYRSYFGLS